MRKSTGNKKKKKLNRNRSLQLNMSNIYPKEEKKAKKRLIPTISAFTMRTRRGKSGNVDKTNQDSFISHPNLNGEPNTHLFGVYDGHGTPPPNF